MPHVSRNRTYHMFMIGWNAYVYDYWSRSVLPHVSKKTELITCLWLDGMPMFMIMTTVGRQTYMLCERCVASTALLAPELMLLLRQSRRAKSMAFKYLREVGAKSLAGSPSRCCLCPNVRSLSLSVHNLYVCMSTWRPLRICFMFKRCVTICRRVTRLEDCQNRWDLFCPVEKRCCKEVTLVDV